MYNKLLDESDRFREDMGDITDNVSLETAWDELESKTGALCGAQQKQHALRMLHCAGEGGLCVLFTAQGLETCYRNAATS